MFKYLLIFLFAASVANAQTISPGTYTATDSAGQKWTLTVTAGSGISPDCSTLQKPPATGSLTTSAGTWTFGGAANGANFVVLLNGAQAAGGVATELEVANSGKLFALNDAGWWLYNGTNWTSQTPTGC